MSEAVVPRTVYFAVFAALLALTALTVVVAFFDLGRFNVITAVTIAVIKASLVTLYFMHVRWSGGLVWVAVSAGAIWLGVMVLLTLSDYTTRPWLPEVGR